MIAAAQTSDNPSPVATARTERGTEALRALILDDSEVDRLRISRLLSKIDRNIEATYAEDLDEFRTKLGICRYDMILLDYVLPKGTGLDAATMIAAHPLQKGIKPIMIAGENPTERVVDAIKSGCVDFLSKDKLSADNLLKAVESAFRSRLDQPVNAQVDGIIAAIDAAGIARIRPLAARIIRHVRIVRTGTTDDRVARSVDEIDFSSSELMEFCVEFTEAMGRLRQTLQ